MRNAFLCFLISSLVFNLPSARYQALLLASMIRNYGGKKYAVWVIEWAGASSAHLAVAVPVLGGDLAILDPAGRFYTKDQYGRLTHKYSGSAVKEWVDYWSTQQKNIQITLALSDTEHQTFSSTNEFIEWALTSVNPSPPKSFFLLYEKIEISAAFPEPVVGGWKVHIIYLNTGSKSTGIDSVFINNVPYNSWGAMLNVTLPIDANIGVQKSFNIYIPAGASFGGQRIVSGTVISIKLHSTGGKEYFTSVVLPLNRLGLDAENGFWQSEKKTDKYFKHGFRLPLHRPSSPHKL